MKLFDINGKMTSVDIRPSKYPMKEQCKSIFQDKIKNLILEKYANYPILEEFNIPGSRLSIDYIIFPIMIAFEIDGEQHRSYNPFFHGQALLNNYGKQIVRDIKKEEWCKINKIQLIRIESIKDADKI